MSAPVIGCFPYEGMFELASMAVFLFILVLLIVCCVCRRDIIEFLSRKKRQKEKIEK